MQECVAPFAWVTHHAVNAISERAFFTTNIVWPNFRDSTLTFEWVELWQLPLTSDPDSHMRDQINDFIPSFTPPSVKPMLPRTTLGFRFGAKKRPRFVFFASGV